MRHAHQRTLLLTNLTYLQLCKTPKWIYCTHLLLSLLISSVSIFSIRKDTQKEAKHIRIYLPGSKEFKHNRCCWAMMWTSNCLQINRLPTDRKRGNRHKLNHNIFLKTLFFMFLFCWYYITMRVVKHWNMVPRDVGSPSLEIFKSCLATVLGNLLEVTLTEHEGWLDDLKRLPQPQQCCDLVN